MKMDYLKLMTTPATQQFMWMTISLSGNFGFRVGMRVLPRSVLCDWSVASNPVLSLVEPLDFFQTPQIP